MIDSFGSLVQFTDFFLLLILIYRKELKRLNVTVIDTANDMSKIKVEEVCQKPFCKLGCVCGSIDSAKYIQTHCRLYDCMFSCVCVDVSKKNNSFAYLSSIQFNCGLFLYAEPIQGTQFILHEYQHRFTASPSECMFSERRKRV